MPQTALADTPTSCPSGDYSGSADTPGPACVTQININIGVDLSNSDASLNGDRITNNGGVYTLVNSGGQTISVIPSAMSVTITDTSTGSALPTFYVDSSNKTYYSNSQGVSGPPTISGDNLQYQVYGSAFGGDTYKICADGVNVQQQCITDPLNNGATHASNSLPLVTAQSIQSSVTLPLPAGSNGAPDTSDNQSATATSESAANSETPSCEASGGPFAWLVCSGAEYLADAEHSLEGVIDNLLTTQPVNFNTDLHCVSGKHANGQACSSEDTYSAKIYQVWSNFRTYGDIVLVIALLVIVFGEVVGGGVIDAYTAKKVLPRILVAAILINLSIYVVTALEDIFNVLGSGIQSLIEAPFNLSSPGLELGKGFAIRVHGGSAALLTLLTGVGVAYAGFSMGIGMLLLLIFGSAFVAVLAILITVMLRQLILVMLVLFAPIAFALYCLPNTERYFKKWWEFLITTLLVYPIIGVVFAMSNIAGTVLSNMNANVTPQVLAEAFSVLAIVAPLFLIPFAFKIAGGLITTISQKVLGIGKNIHNPIRSMARKRAEDRIGRVRSGAKIYDPSTARGRLGNKVTSLMFDPDSNYTMFAHQHGFGGMKGNQLSAKLHHMSMEQATNLYKELQETDMFNDKAGRALAGAYVGFTGKVLQADGTYKTTGQLIQEAGLHEAPKSVQELNTIAGILAQSDSATERNGAEALKTFAPRMASIWADQENGRASTQAAGLWLMSAHGFAEPEDIAKVVSDVQHEDKEMAWSIGARAQVMGQQQRPDLKAGYGLVLKDGKYESVFDPGNEDRARALVTTLNSHDLAAAKGGSIARLAPTIHDMLSGDLRVNGQVTQHINLEQVAQKIQNGETVTAAETRAYGEAQAVKDQLFQWVGPYSQASVDVKRRALDIIRDQGLWDQYQATLRTQVSPSPEQLDIMRDQGEQPPPPVPGQS